MKYIEPFPHFTLSADTELPQGSDELNELMPDLSAFLLGGGEIIRVHQVRQRGILHLGWDATTLCKKSGDEAETLFHGVEYKLCEKCGRRGFHDVAGDD